MSNRKFYKCDYCGKLFIPHSSTIAKIERGEQKTVCCSRKCGSMLKKKTVITNCDNCGKEIERKKSHYDRQVKLGQHQFCSLKCQKELMHKETYEIRKCEICNSEFECAKISPQRFCSIQCQGKWQSTVVGDDNPRSTKVHYNCDYCGKDYLVKKYKLSQNHNFCSKECVRNWYAEVYSQTEEYREMCRKRTIKMLEDGKMPTVFTKPQLIVNDILNECKINFINNYGIDYYSIDNYLVESKLMIEVMGDYWHSNPNIFDKDKLNSTQKDIIIKDGRKHTYINNTYNIEVLYVWEYDIYNNYETCKKLINKYISNNGLLNNYHSFNYCLIDDNLTINDTIIFPYSNI